MTKMLTKEDKCHRMIPHSQLSAPSLQNQPLVSSDCCRSVSVSAMISGFGMKILLFSLSLNSPDAASILLLEMSRLLVLHRGVVCQLFDARSLRQSGAIGTHSGVDVFSPLRRRGRGGIETGFCDDDVRDSLDNMAMVPSRERERDGSTMVNCCTQQQQQQQQQHHQGVLGSLGGTRDCY